MHCPPGPVLIMFFFLLLQSANLNLLLWGEQEDEGKKKVFNLQKVQRFSLNKHKNFQCASKFLELAKLLRIPRELPCIQDLGPALWSKSRAGIMSRRAREREKE